ncbi:transposable element Tcb2 transposase [Trichonephila clavipes]|nr:transposable element Tcb2 transposase [Trichonephila clavipes]
MPLCRFRKQYEQLSLFERGRIIGMMEAGWSAKRVARQLGCSDCVILRGERLNPAFALQRRTAVTAGVIIWGVTVYNTRSPLVLIRGTTHDSPALCPWHPETTCVATDARFPGAIFQQDNAQPHTARVSQDCLRTVTILPWSA